MRELKEKFIKWRADRKIRKLEDNFYKEVENLFSYNKDVLKIDIFFSFKEVDDDLDIFIFNLRDIIKDEIVEKPFVCNGKKMKYSMRYNNYLMLQRDLNGIDYDLELYDIYHKIKMYLLISAKFDEKKIDDNFYIILKRKFR